MTKELNYTKGKWYTEEDSMEEVAILVIPEGEDFPDTIATVRLIGNFDGIEMEANAQLIASAPDLYEALKAIIDAEDEHFESLGYGRSQDARKALAKTEGK